MNKIVDTLMNLINVNDILGNVYVLTIFILKREAKKQRICQSFLFGPYSWSDREDFDLLLEHLIGHAWKRYHHNSYLAQLQAHNLPMNFGELTSIYENLKWNRFMEWS